MQYGWKRSQGPLGVPAFTRSSTIIKLGAATPATQYVITERTPISDQLAIEDCVSNAGCDMLEILYGIENPTIVPNQLSRLFLYWNSRLYDQTTDKNVGTYIHNAMNSLTNLGVCRESLWPYDQNKIFAQPPVLCYKEGDDNTLNTFYQIMSSDAERLADIEAAIRADHPVIFGTEIGAELENYDGNPNTVIDVTKAASGGHCMLVVGVRTNTAGNKEFLIRNSWGTGWGLTTYPGHAWVTGGFLTSADTSDLFVGTKMANLLV